MPNVFYVFWIALGALVAFMMILYFMLGQTSTSISANTLNTAVHDGIEYSSDYDSRVSRGAYVINPHKFIYFLDHSQIKDLSGFNVANTVTKQTQHSRHDVFAVRFLKDDKSNTKDNHDWINATNYSHLRNSEVPVRMVQVQAIPDVHFTEDGYHYQPNWTGADELPASRKYASTYAIDVEDGKQNPVKDPNLDKGEHYHADLTDNEYAHEGGQDHSISSQADPNLVSNGEG